MAESDEIRPASDHELNRADRVVALPMLEETYHAALEYLEPDERAGEADALGEILQRGLSYLQDGQRLAVPAEVRKRLGDDGLLALAEQTIRPTAMRQVMKYRAFAIARERRALEGEVRAMRLEHGPLRARLEERRAVQARLAAEARRLQELLAGSPAAPRASVGIGAPGKVVQFIRQRLRFLG